MKYLKFLSFAILFTTAISNAFSCTSYLVTPGASVDGSSMISYAADSHIRYGELYHFKGGPKAPGSYFQAYYRGSHKPLAKIPYPAYTYNVIGYINEMQVALGETTFGGRNELNDSTGMIDYGSLMFYTLQTAKTARDAIRIISELVDEYGYYGMGESFSIADPNEVWIMEIIGKGTDLKKDPKTGKVYNANKGAVWVAIKIPDGYISAHANHARITTFPQKKSKESITNKEFKKLFDPNVRVIYAHDVVEFARKQKYYNGKDEDFSFSDVYAPLDFGAARFCEARVWSAFRKVNGDMERYKDYAMGYDKTNRMPLYIKPERKLSVQDLIDFKRDYLQGTEFDMTQDIGAGPWGLPIRWRPLTWTVDSVEYFHERTTVTQQTAFSFITQSRKNYPGPIGGIIWFGVDDTNLSVYVPMYAGMTRVPETFAEGNGSIIEYSENSAFWTFNKLSHFVYLRYSLQIDDVRKVQSQLENRFAELVPAIDLAASELYKADKELAIDFITDFSVNMGNSTVERWQELYRFLMVKYLDGNLKKEVDGKFLTNKYGKYPIVSHPNYPEWWLKLIIEKTGDKFIYEK
ncbi:MAG: C69 family dipeptidase [Bacteroidetes bacterium]|nr:C69 family dipeptidase [Bacteroidota bacterium]